MKVLTKEVPRALPSATVAVRVTVKKLGEAYTQDFNVGVTKEFVPVTGIDNITIPETYDLSETGENKISLTGAKISPANATGQTIRWTVTDNKGYVWLI